MISRNFTWVNEDIEHSDSDHARAAALAAKWSSLQTQEEERGFRRQSDYEDGGRDLDVCEDCAACEAGDYSQCEQVKEFAKRAAQIQAARDLEIELIEDKLDAIGARMMRAYEHWNEDERYMQYMEEGRFA